MSEPSDTASGKGTPNDTSSDATSAGKASASRASFENLPHVESPSLSLAGDETAKNEPIKDGPVKNEPALEPATQNKDESAADTAAGKLIVLPRVNRPRMTMTMSRRTKRAVRNAAAIAIAAGFGAIVGVLAMQSFTPSTPKQDVASVEERQAMQKSIARLARDVTTLKSSVENTKVAQTQVGKTAARVDSARRDDDIVTGSIAVSSTLSAPETKAASVVAAATAATITAPLPQPRPQAAQVPQVVTGWSAHMSPDGFVLVEQRGGDLYQVTPGVPLPGLGKVEAIHRDGGRIEVVTARGIIVSPPRQSVRNRVYRAPPFFEPY